MKSKYAPYSWSCVAFCLLLPACETKVPPGPAPVAAAPANATLDRISEIVAEQMKVARSKVKPDTTHGELKMDDSDFYEIAKKCETTFKIKLPIRTTEGLTGTDGLRFVTVGKLAAFVDDQVRQQQPKPSGPETH